MENYHILERIGEGSFGKVYRGRRKYSGHIVALKFVTKQGKSERDLENLRQEINILRQMKHCNIIAMMDSFETDGEFCMVTEYAQGELFQVLEDEHNLPEQEIRKITIQLIQALHMLHSNRIIHRDMKPQNILIGSREQIKLCDFGFARAIKHNSSLLRSIKGTPLYMAPELVQEKPYNHTVDLWSLGVILYELAVGKPPFYTDKIVSLIQMIVRDDIVYPSTMSQDFQSFLKGLLTKNPAQRLQWPELLEHRFVKETSEELEKRLQLERQMRALPRFFKENEMHNVSKSGKVEKVKPSVERVRSCDEWKICDPETGRQISKSDLNHAGEKDLSPPADENNNNWDDNMSPNVPTKIENFLNLWKRINCEIDEKHIDDAQITPLFPSAVRLLTSIPVKEFSNEIIAKILSLLHLFYRPMVNLVKNTDQVVNFGHLLRSNDSLHQFLTSLLQTSDTMLVNREKASDLICKTARCCMVCTTIVNQIDIGLEKDFNYREFCQNDIKNILLMLTIKVPFVATLRSKALKWLGSMLDRSRQLMTLLDVVYTSGLIPILCDILDSSGISSSPVKRNATNEQDGGLYAIFALSAFVQPDAKCWNSFQSFPLMSLVGNNSNVPMKSPSLRDVKHLYKLRTKIHSEVASQLVQKGVKELITLLGDEITEYAQQKRTDSSGKDEDKATGEEEADLSTACCILKILMHACRTSSSFSKKITITKVLFQKHRHADVFTILLWGMASKGLNRIEQYFAIELLSAILRRGIVSKSQIWSWAQALYPVLLNTNDVALLSALSTFFAEVIEHCNIDESALDRDGSSGALELQDAELFNLVAHGALTERCANAVFRLFSNNWTDDSESDTKAEMFTSYNLRAQGLLDAGIVFLLRVASKASVQPAAQCRNEQEEGGTRSNETNVFLAVFERKSVWEIYDDMMATCGQNLLSPWGLFCFLKLLRMVREMQCHFEEIEVSIKEHLLLHLVNLLELQHLESLFAWPEIVGGGSHAVKALVHATVKVLGIPFAYRVSDELLEDTQEILYDAKCVQKLLAVLRFMFSTKELQLGSSVLELPISFLSRLVTSSSHFGSQFVQADGTLIVKECGMLRSNGSPSLIIDTLLILSQLARSSETNYHCLLMADLFPELSNLLQHPEAMVRAKTLNCLGNFCRHSALFYPHFIKHSDRNAVNVSVMDGTIRGLLDSDSYVRRFACFAIGNAAFHSDELYDALRPALAGLIENLADDEEKTRSNAGGALGNLVRNSDKLCTDLCTYQAPLKLFESAMAEKSTASRRIVLFSLGNFCVYPMCVKLLSTARPTFVEELELLYDKVVIDEVSRRNIRRIIAKIEALSSA